MRRLGLVVPLASLALVTPAIGLDWPRWRGPGLNGISKGELIVCTVKPEKFESLARAPVLGGKCWTVPVLSNGRIYCRNVPGNLVSLDVAEKQIAANR